MLFKYSAVDQAGQQQDGTIDITSRDAAISALQKRGLTIYSVDAVSEKGDIFSGEITFFTRVSSEDLVVLSRQIATLIQARVSALEVFRVLAGETENQKLKKVLESVANDIQAGSSLSGSFSKYPDVFSLLFVNMVKAGEESGKLSEVFGQLADHLERSHDLLTKTRNALIYPAFIIVAFGAVMILMFTMVIPRISDILTESGQELPIYTKIVLSTSDFMAANWLGLLMTFALIVVGLVWYARTEEGESVWDNFTLSIPLVGNLYKRLYLSRFADTMHTMINSGIPIVRAIEISENVVGSRIYKRILTEVREDVRGGSSLSGALERHPEVSGIFTQMVRVGEESGQLANMLDTISQFYRREVNSAVDTLIGLIEPVMIVVLGIGVAVLLASILMPIYNLVGAF